MCEEEKKIWNLGYILHAYLQQISIQKSYVDKFPEEEKKSKPVGPINVL